MRRHILMSAGFVVLSTWLGIGLVAGQKPTKGDPAKGKDDFEQCAVCHNVDTDETKMGPSLKGLFQRKTLKSGKPVNDANVLSQINNGGNGMPAYADMLTADQKADILAYLHTL